MKSPMTNPERDTPEVIIARIDAQMEKLLSEAVAYGWEACERGETSKVAVREILDTYRQARRNAVTSLPHQGVQ